MRCIVYAMGIAMACIATAASATLCPSSVTCSGNMTTCKSDSDASWTNSRAWVGQDTYTGPLSFVGASYIPKNGSYQAAQCLYGDKEHTVYFVNLNQNLIPSSGKNGWTKSHSDSLCGYKQNWNGTNQDCPWTTK